MRKDMSKILTDEPRHGARLKDRKGRKRAENRVPDEEKPIKEPHNLRYRWEHNGFDAKQFGEHLGPLRRFILSCVGRPWNDVYSEICEHVSRDNVVQKHIFTHLWQYVATNVYMKDGLPYDKTYGLTIYQDTYVHPDTGILCKTPQERKRRHVHKNVDYIRINKDEIYYKQEGIWYRCTMRDLPVDSMSASGYDILTKETWSWKSMWYDILQTYLSYMKSDIIRKYTEKYGAPQCCVEKRQVGKTELKKLRQQINRPNQNHRRHPD
jgi:hypothetical protein